MDEGWTQVPDFSIIRIGGGYPLSWLWLGMGSINAPVLFISALSWLTTLALGFPMTMHVLGHSMLMHGCGAGVDIVGSQLWVLWTKWWWGEEKWLAVVQKRWGGGEKRKENDMGTKQTCLVSVQNVPGTRVYDALKFPFGVQPEYVGECQVLNKLVRVVWSVQLKSHDIWLKWDFPQYPLV